MRTIATCAAGSRKRKGPSLAGHSREVTVSWIELNWLGDAELLGRIGRSSLGGTLGMLRPYLAQQNIALPDTALPDTLYFAKLAVIFRSQPVKVMAYLPPFLVSGTPAEAQESLPAGATPAPEPGPADVSLAAKVFQLLTALDPDNRLRKAPPIKVFLLRYRQNLSRSEIARTCHCDKSLVALRLKTLRDKLPWKPEQLRELSAQVEAMQAAVSDSRGRSIYRKGAVYGDADGEEGFD